MTAYADLSEYVNRITGGNSGTPENLFCWKDARVAGAAAVATVAGRITSLWRYEGIPSHGADPTTVAAPTNATDGALKQTDPGGGREKWLGGVSGCALAAGTLILYDRLLHIGSLNATTITAQTVGGTLTRNTGGVGNMIWAEVYTIIGTTATTITASYTNQAGTASRTTAAVAFGATGLREVGRIIPLSLQAGDTGVQAVASCTVLATTGTAGNFGITVARPLAMISIGSAGVGAVKSFMDGPMPEIDTGACLAWAWVANGTSAPQFAAQLSMAER
jgi:hypothetical protein